jgi:hypothetical protein
MISDIVGPDLAVVVVGVSTLLNVDAATAPVATVTAAAPAFATVDVVGCVAIDFSWQKGKQ